MCIYFTKDLNVSRGLTTAEFIHKASFIHECKYAYGECVYTTAKNKVLITCATHGNFEQSATVHLQGHGCPSCYGGASKTEEDFIEQRQVIHGDLYTYNNVVYTKYNIKVSITCGIHGDFMQAPLEHSRGRGCPQCASIRAGGWGVSRYISSPTTLYLIQLGKDIFKLGLTKESVERRYRRETAVYHIIDTWDFADGAQAFRIEQAILKETLANSIPNNNIFSHGGNSEVRNVNLLPYILSRI